MKTFWLLVALLLPLHGKAQTLYKCVVDGNTAYQSSPCKTGKQQVACANPRGQTTFSSSTDKTCEKEPDYSAESYYATPSTYSATSRNSSSKHKPGTDVQVQSYTRKDGTVVRAHTRASRK